MVRRSARELHDWVRALTLPYPGAFTTVAGRRGMVWRTRPPDGSHAPAAAGTVLDRGPAGLRVATGRGVLVVTELSDPEARPQRAHAWCVANRIDPGSRFADVPRVVADWALGLGPRPPIEEAP